MTFDHALIGEHQIDEGELPDLRWKDAWRWRLVLGPTLDHAPSLLERTELTVSLPIREADRERLMPRHDTAYEIATRQNWSECIRGHWRTPGASSLGRFT